MTAGSSKRKSAISIRLRLAALGALVVAPAAAMVGPTVDASPYADEVVMILTRGPEGSGFCTGVVLAPRVVLTAAHCLRKASDMLVHFRDASGAPVLIDVTATIRHPDFHADAAEKRVRSIDIGLVETKSALPERFRPAALAGGAPPGPGEKAIGAGFGVAEERQAKTGGTLRAARLAVREPHSSVLLWLEGADGEGGACQGDSGGPIFSEDGRLLVAIIAWTEGKSGQKCGKLTQGVLVAPLAGWIATETQQLLAEGGAL